MVSFNHKLRPFPNRHVLFLSTLFILSLFLLRHYPYNPLHQLRDFQLLDRLREALNPNGRWSPPPPLSRELPLIRGSPLTNDLANHSWTRPMVLTTFVRPLQGNVSRSEVFIYATGVSLGNYKRDITVVGCVVGRDVYKAFDATGEVYFCEVPHTVALGEPVSLVLLRDDALARAMEGETIGGLLMKIFEEDVKRLTNDSRLHIDESVDDLVKISSDARITHIAPTVEALQERPRYRLCMATQMKTFAHLLPDWASYHLRLGIDRIYILDNSSPDDLSTYLDSQSAEIVQWPFQKSQTQAMSFLLLALRERCEWVLLSDADEYLMLGLYQNGSAGLVDEFLDGVERKREIQIFLPYLTMGPSGHVNITEGSVAEEYLYKYERQKVNGKTLISTNAEWMSSRIHAHRAKDQAPVTRHGVAKERPLVGDAPVLVHFQKRSFEEVLIKQEAGSGSLADMQIGERRGKRVKVAPGYYRRVDEKLRYTYFRDVWREVLREEGTVCLVRGASGERRCV